jgi:hypothetical protein
VILYLAAVAVVSCVVFRIICTPWGKRLAWIIMAVCLAKLSVP